MADEDRGVETRAPRPGFRIFLSSTSRDLGEYRRQVDAAVSRLQHQSVRMEIFGARPRAPFETCLEQVAEADALVVIVAHRYGWVPSVKDGGDGKKSITWHEVQTALESGRPVFAFLVDPDYPWSGDREELRIANAKTKEEAAAILAAVHGLKEFKDFIDGAVTRDTFTTPPRSGGEGCYQPVSLAA